ncbi:hypothetical protein PInf_014293 [Phytophthora infestans]|nr:hypothetical protein PInf_014293 [Phytophthora infestans]
MPPLFRDYDTSCEESGHDCQRGVQVAHAYVCYATENGCEADGRGPLELDADYGYDFGSDESHKLPCQMDSEAVHSVSRVLMDPPVSGAATAGGIASWLLETKVSAASYE